jgi:hypothetical protein
MGCVVESEKIYRFLFDHKLNLKEIGLGGLWFVPVEQRFLT